MSETPRYEFIGREADLRILTEAWDATATGTPQVVLVRGDSGVGKTRLMQEFFAWLSSHHDKFHYWREIPADRKKALSLVPALADRPVGESPDLPWLWLAARCQEPIHASERVVAFDAVRHQIALHLAGIFQAQRRRAIHTGLAKAAFGFVASFALPGSGAVIEVVNAVLEGGSGTLSGYELYDAIKSKVGATRSESLTLQDVVSREQESIKESALKAFGALFAGTPAPPVVLTIDDAHWVDETTCDVLKAVLGVAGAQHWPLMVVLLSWDEPLRFEDSLVPCPALTAFVAPAHRADGVRFVEHDLTPLHAGQLSRLIQQRLPRLERDGATLLVERSAGDIDLLDDFVEELLHSPGWLDGDGRLAVPVPALLKLPSSATDMARRRLNAAGDEIREALTWASAQGNQFDEAIIRDLLGTMGRVKTLHDSLLQSDSRFGFIKTAAHELLELSGEFRRRLYFDTCRDFFQQHPRGQEFLRQLASALLALAESPVWQALDGAHAQRLGSRLLALVDELNLAGRQWDPTVHAVLGQLAQSRLALGDARGAEHYAQRLVGARTASPAAKEAARKTLIAAAYMEGDIARERSHLDAWHRSRKRSAPYYVLESMYAMRQGASSRSISMARKAQAAARTERDRLDAAIGLATALWSAGRPEASHKAITEAEHAFGRIDVSRADRISLHHATALALHDLERNMQVVYRANQCVAGYRESGNKQQEIISRVNLGDALWGVGRASEAAAQLETAYAEARATHLPHAEDIAAICFANALREQGKHEAALEKIGTGIELAGRIGHLWDKTYGEIYQEAILLERDPAASVARLDATARPCARSEVSLPRRARRGDSVRGPHRITPDRIAAADTKRADAVSDIRVSRRGGERPGRFGVDARPRRAVPPRAGTLRRHQGPSRIRAAGARSRRTGGQPVRHSARLRTAVARAIQLERRHGHRRAVIRHVRLPHVRGALLLRRRLSRGR